MKRKGKNGLTPDVIIQNLISTLDKCAFEGKKPSLSFLIQQLLEYFMTKERQLYLQANSEDMANGFYQSPFS